MVWDNNCVTDVTLFGRWGVVGVITVQSGLDRGSGGHSMCLGVFTLFPFFSDPSPFPFAAVK